MGQRLLSVASLGVFCACVLVFSSHPSFAAGESKAAKALMTVDDDWSKTAVAKNLDALASYVAEDGVAYPPNEPIAVGREAVRKVWAANFAVPGFQISWQANAGGVAKSTGWTAGTYRASFNGPDGKPMVQNGKYVTVWRKGADGRWQVVRDIWNSDAK